MSVKRENRYVSLDSIITVETMTKMSEESEERGWDFEWSEDHSSVTVSWGPDEDPEAFVLVSLEVVPKRRR